IGGDHRFTIGGDRTGRIEGEDKLEIGKMMNRHVVGGLRAVVEQGAEVNLAAGLSLAIGGTYAVQVGGDRPAQSDHYVLGSHSLGASERIVIRAAEGLVIACGDTSITLS